jgi:hypothetical protein
MNEERMSILKELTGKEFAVEITDLSDLKEGDTGTLVCLRLPAEFQLPDEF